MDYALKTRLPSILSVSPRTIGRWSRRIDKDAKDAQQREAFGLWLACHTQESIADRLGVPQQTVARWLEDLTDFRQIAKIGKVAAHFPGLRGLGLQRLEVPGQGVRRRYGCSSPVRSRTFKQSGQTWSLQVLRVEVVDCQKVPGRYRPTAHGLAALGAKDNSSGRVWAAFEHCVNHGVLLGFENQAILPDRHLPGY